LLLKPQQRAEHGVRNTLQRNTREDGQGQQDQPEAEGFLGGKEWSSRKQFGVRRLVAALSYILHH
jgi:hypothetical protein